MRKTVQLLLLILALSATARAGDVQCPLQQPTTCNTTQSVADTDGIIHSDSPAALTETVLSVLVSILPLA